YREAKLSPRVRTPKRSETAAISEFSLPKFHVTIMRRVLAERRHQKRLFAKNRDLLLAEIARCARGQIYGDAFYEKLPDLWTARFQAPGYERQGRSANWRQACASLLKIVRKPLALEVSDHAVVQELEHLAHVKNALRGAWFSEMLCQFQPARYPV